MEKLFTVDTIKDTIGENSFKLLEQHAINAGANFLNGKVTNATTKVMSNSSVQNAEAMISGGLGATVSALEMYDNIDIIIGNLTKQIVDKAINIITKQVTSIASDFIAKNALAISNWPKNVSQKSLNVFNQNKKDIGEIIAALTQTSESQLEEQENQSNANDTAEVTKKSKKNIEDINKTITETVSNATREINKVSDYIENGPDMLADFIDKLINEQIQKGTKELNNVWIKAKKFYSDSEDECAEKTGLMMARKYNKALENAQKKLLEKTEKQKSKLSIKLSTVKVKAIQAIAAKTGFTAPIPDVPMPKYVPSSSSKPEAQGQAEPSIDEKENQKIIDSYGGNPPKFIESKQLSEELVKSDLVLNWNQVYTAFSSNNKKWGENVWKEGKDPKNIIWFNKDNINNNYIGRIYLDKATYDEDRDKYLWTDVTTDNDLALIEQYSNSQNQNLLTNVPPNIKQFDIKSVYAYSKNSLEEARDQCYIKAKKYNDNPNYILLRNIEDYNEIDGYSYSMVYVNNIIECYAKNETLAQQLAFTKYYYLLQKTPTNDFKIGEVKKYYSVTEGYYKYVLKIVENDK